MTSRVAQVEQGDGSVVNVLKVGRRHLLQEVLMGAAASCHGGRFYGSKHGGYHAKYKLAGYLQTSGGCPGKTA